MLADAGALDSLVVTDPAEAAAIWRIREDGAGLAARTCDGRPAHAGWEDAAVPAERLGAYLRELRGAARPARAAVRAVRALRRRLHARADRLRLRRRRPDRGRAAVPGVRRGRRPAGGRLRRLAVRRARRRPGPQRAAAAHVLPRRHRPVRAGQGGLRPRRRAQPRRPRPARPPSTTTSAWRPPPSCASGWRWPTGTTAATSPRPSTAAPAWASAAPTCGLRRRHVPVVAGHAGGEGHHPRPGAGAAGDAGRRRAGDRLALPGGARRARPVPVLQGLLPRLPDRRRHGLLQGRGAAPVLPPPAAARARTTRWAGCRAGPTSPPGRRAGQRACSGPGSAAGWPSGRPAWTSAARCRPSPRAPSASSGPRGRCASPTDGTPSRCGWTRSPTTSPRRWRMRPRGCSRRPATACRSRAPTPAAG